LKKLKLFATIAVLVLSVGLLIVACCTMFNQEKFYVGVTYCGSSVQEAKELIDKVKNYTNLFVLQSGTFMGDTTAMEDIGDYVVASNLNYAVSGSVRDDYGTSIVRDNVGLDPQVLSNWLIEAKGRWGKHFIGVYYGDEPGGKMLDTTVTFKNIPLSTKEGTTRGIIEQVTKNSYTGVITSMFSNETIIRYYPNGNISMSFPKVGIVDYCPDGTIVAYKYVFENNAMMVYTFDDLTHFPLSIPSYETVLKQKPLQTCDDATVAFVNKNKGFLDALNKKQLDKKSISVFTADYGLYWWDYQSGYDVVLAELAWNNSVAQQIGLVRGAANLQSKSWGTMITWKYTQPPYLADGAEMFEQMKMSYEAGAECVLIFNYSEDPVNPNTLQEEHFLALERFWNNVVQNSDVVHGGVKAEAVFVLPKNYGWGMRAVDDNIWGIWSTDETMQELWVQLQNSIDQYGLKLDIVFEEPMYSIAGKYFDIYYWNQ